MEKLIAIKPVKTEFNTYDLVRISVIEQPMDTCITTVFVLSKQEMEEEFDDFGSPISANFTSLPKFTFAYNPGSLCDRLLPQMEDQGIIERVEGLNLYSGFTKYAAYRFTEQFLKENNIDI